MQIATLNEDLWIQILSFYQMSFSLNAKGKSRIRNYEMSETFLFSFTFSFHFMLQRNSLFFPGDATAAGRSDHSSLTVENAFFTPFLTSSIIQLHFMPRKCII